MIKIKQVGLPPLSNYEILPSWFQLVRLIDIFDIWVGQKVSLNVSRFFQKTVRLAPDRPPPRPLPLNKWTSWEAPNPAGGSPLFGNWDHNVEMESIFHGAPLLSPPGGRRGSRMMGWVWSPKSPKSTGFAPICCQPPSPPQIACLTWECEERSQIEPKTRTRSFFLRLIGPASGEYQWVVVGVHQPQALHGIRFTPGHCVE